VDIGNDAEQLVLDINNLDIQRIVLQPGNITATYSTGDIEPYLGQPLMIDLQPGIKSVEVHYSTRAGVSALDWLEPEQTAGGRYPFMYTQSQPVLARSFFPCQDTPGIRFPYEATIATPPELMAVMSAVNPQKLSEDGIYHFEMEQPIPSYLVALAVGELEFRSLGSRTGVYAEPELIEAAAYEFALTEDMLAHSWSGNLVTNASWEELWINEGFTVYFENRIMEKIYGHEHEQMLATLSLGELREELDDYGWDHPDTRLKIDLKGRDPDSSFTAAAYTKGGLFLLSMEQQLGRQRWDPRRDFWHT
jgi:aminopeptidase N